MRNLVLTGILCSLIGIFNAKAQIDEADPKDNKRYEMEMDSINQVKVMQTPLVEDSTSAVSSDSATSTNPESKNLKNTNGNDKAIRERSIKDEKMKSDKIKKNKENRMQQE
jgi:hypothetical protein